MFRYSPLFAWLVGLIAPIGVLGMRLLHLAVLPLMGWRLALVALLSWPFWQDVQVGNVVTFVVVAGVLALRGNQWGTGAYLAIAMLAPRPFLLPLFAWIIWRRPEWRIPVLLAVIVHAGVVLATGYADDWIRILVQPNLDFGAFYDFGPARLLGSWWIIIGIPLAVVLTWRGHVGLASLAIQPYWLGYYLLMPLLELVTTQPRPESRPECGRRSPR